MQTFPPDPKIIIALDQPDKSSVLDFVKQLDPNYCRLKIGHILFTQYGPSLVETLMRLGFSIFLDLKFHDIPQTVAGACRAAASLGVWMTNVHILGGQEMLQAACDAINEHSANPPLLLGVTVLTSLNNEDLQKIGMTKPIEEIIINMANNAYTIGLNGVVCSSQEAKILRQQFPKNFLLVTPGIRLTQNEYDDQKRVMTPQAAIAAGADYLVIGRPITQAANPMQVLSQIISQI